jgi:archaetidylinositol phosphate synthase
MRNLSREVSFVELAERGYNMQVNNSANHKRVNDILLGPLERPALKWLAAHSPTWMTPDILTGIGVLGSVVILVGYILSRFHPGFFWLASFGLFLNWYGDSLDGTLARYRHIERPVFGFYIDHTTDAATQVLIFIGMGVSPYISFNVAILTLVAYMLVSVLAYVRTCVVAEFKISYGKLGPTEARVLLFLLNTAMFIFGKQFFPVKLGFLGRYVVSPYDLVVGSIGLLLLFFFLNTGTREAIRLVKENR